MILRRVIRGRFRRWLLARLAPPRGALSRQHKAEASGMDAGLSMFADHAARSAFLREHVFIQTHVPKTGGTALFHNLTSVFGGVHSLDLRLRKSVAFASLPLDEMDGVHFISGHENFGLHQHIDRIPLYLASVREPVARAVSAYRYFQTATHQDEHATCRDLPFDEAWHVMDRDFPLQRRERQSRMIWGGKDLGPDHWDKLAVRVENDYFLVMPHERMDEAVQRLREALGLYKAPLQRVNVSRTPEFEPSEAMTRTIREANPLDARLYDHVVETFDARLDRACRYVAERCLQPMPLDAA